MRLGGESSGVTHREETVALALINPKLSCLQELSRKLAKSLEQLQDAVIDISTLQQELQVAFGPTAFCNFTSCDFNGC